MPLTITESRSLAALEKARGRVADTAHVVAETHHDHQARERKRAAFEAVNGTLTQADTSTHLHRWLLVLAVAAAYCVDCVLAASMTDQVADQTGAGSGFIRGLMRFGLPAAIVLFEVVIGDARARAINDSHGQPTHRARGLLALGLLLALAMPAFVVATQAAAYLALPETDRSATVLAAAATVGLLAISVSLHLFLLFFGGETMEAKSHVVGTLTRRSLAARELQSERRVNAASHRLDQTYTTYEMVRQAHNTAFPHLHREQGPFAAQTVRLVNQVLFDNQPAVTPAAPVPVPPAAPAGRLPDDEVVL